MIELYQANADYIDMMDLMEDMVAHVAEKSWEHAGLITRVRKLI